MQSTFDIILTFTNMFYNIEYSPLKFMVNKSSPALGLWKQFQTLWNNWKFFFSQQVAEGKQEEIQQKGQAEKKELQHKIDEMEEKEQELQAKIEALQADNDFTNERLTALQGKLANPEVDLIWFFFFYLWNIFFLDFYLQYG